jgi:hypothetical protein
MKIIWTSLEFVLICVLGERSEDGSNNHIQFEKRR